MTSAKKPAAKKEAKAPKVITTYKGFDKDLSCLGFKYEQWRQIPGFAKLYEVSTLGRARSMPRNTACGVLGGKLLRPQLQSNGYLRITLSKDGVCSRLLLHRAVLFAFVGKCPAGQECRHLDGVRTNCSLINLAWGTRAQNSIDRIGHGTQVNNKGERHGMTTLSDADAAEILRLRRSGKPISEVATQFSTSQAAVSRIATGKGWTHISNGFSS